MSEETEEKPEKEEYIKIRYKDWLRFATDEEIRRREKEKQKIEQQKEKEQEETEPEQEEDTGIRAILM